MVEEHGVSRDIAKYLIKTYGDRAFDIAASYFDKDENKQRLHENYPITVGEIRYNIVCEMGVTPIDILFRRTRLGFLDSDAIYTVYPKLVEIFGEEYKWTDSVKTLQQKEHFEMIRKMNF